MAKQRPINLNLLTIKFPIPAIVSILHRVSGTIVFFLIPLLLWMLQTSLSSSDRFIDLQDLFNGFVFKGIIWLFLAALLFHLVAGLRHLLMDCGFGESLKAGRCSAWTAIGLAVILTLLAGIWLWVN